MVRSSSFSQTGAIAMLHAIARERGDGQKWSGDDAAQQWVAQMLTQAGTRLDNRDLPARTFAAPSGAEINRALAARGFTIRVPDFGPPHMGAAAIYEADIRFKHPGVPGTRVIDGKTYPWVTMYNGANLWKKKGDFGAGDMKFIQIPTVGGEEVYLIPCDQQLTSIEIIEFVLREIRQKPNLTEDYGGVSFPMAHMTHRPDLGWMRGMRRGQGELHVALQENSIALDHLGAMVRSGTAGVEYLSSGACITTPYVFAVIQDGLVHFAALLAQDSWRNPADGNPLVLEDDHVPVIDTVPEFSLADDPLTDAEQPVEEEPPSMDSWWAGMGFGRRS